MIGIGIDIGSTAAKAAVVDGVDSVAWTCVQPTGFSSVDAAERLCRVWRPWPRKPRAPRTI